MAVNIAILSIRKYKEHIRLLGIKHIKQSTQSYTEAMCIVKCYHLVFFHTYKKMLILCKQIIMQKAKSPIVPSRGCNVYTRKQSFEHNRAEYCYIAKALTSFKQSAWQMARKCPNSPLLKPFQFQKRQSCAQQLLPYPHLYNSLHLVLPHPGRLFNPVQMWLFGTATNTSALGRHITQTYSFKAYLSLKATAGNVKTWHTFLMCPQTRLVALCCKSEMLISLFFPCECLLVEVNRFESPVACIRLDCNKANGDSIC